MGDARVRAGLAYGLVAYGWWGLIPLYFTALKRAGVPAWEILAHRIAWSLPVLLGLTAAAGGWGELRRVFRSGKLVLTLLASAMFLAVNWLLYIFATTTGRVAEAGLGYYMMPHVNAALATAFLGERLRPLHYPALALVAVGVAVPVAAAGAFPWIAVTLAVSFGVYGVIRKQMPVDGMTGLTVESLLMLPASLAFLGYLSATGANHLGGDPTATTLIVFSGVVTVVPLLAFTLSIRRLPLLAITVIQVLSPTVQVLLAVAVLGESLTADYWAALGCVWAAVALFIGDAAWRVRRERKTVAAAARAADVAARPGRKSGAVPRLLAPAPVTR